MKIKQVSELTGVPASAIRYYESQGLLPSTKRTASGYRQYSDEDILNIRMIKFCQNLGFRLNELEILFAPKEDMDQELLLASLQEKQGDIAELIAQLCLKQKQLAVLEQNVESYWSAGQCVPQEKVAEMFDKIESLTIKPQ